MSDNIEYEQGAPPPGYTDTAEGVGESSFQEENGTYQPPASSSDEAFFTQDDDGAKLPPPSQMGSEESLILREWRRQKAAELEEKARLSKEKHEEILEAAKAELDNFYKKRELMLQQSKVNKREKESTYVASLQELNNKASTNFWESVCGLVNFDVPSKKEKAKKSNEPVRTSQLLNESKASKQTDLSRFRQTLLKLKHQPPSATSSAVAPSS